MNNMTNAPSCSVYANASARLLNRSVPADYRAQQTERVSQQQLTGQKPSQKPGQKQSQGQSHTQNANAEQLSVLIFRLGQEWLALPAHLCQQILCPIPFHTLPHRSNPTLLGIINVRGQLLFKVSLFEVLGLSPSLTPAAHKPTQAKQSKRYPRMIVLEKPVENDYTEIWAFDVDELDGVHSVRLSQLEPAAGIASAEKTCVDYVFAWHQQRVSVLDENRLFSALRRRSL